jgi:elongation factor P--(R)-beta-lysine ligase
MHKNLDLLRDRANMLAQSRSFFSERNVLEVDCPLLSELASVDAHIDLIPAVYAGRTPCYLHSSPEYRMKRLISLGIGDIYQLGHVFRDGESSQKHNPEFTMAEWYRLGIPFEKMIEETVDYVRLFLGPLPCRTISYREAFKTYLGIDYVTQTEEDLYAFILSKGIQPYEGILNEGKDALLNLILGSLIEPQLGQNEICVLAYYPSTQAALAQTQTREDEQVAERFEIYYRGIELANGYHELVDAKEQRKRFEEANAQRHQLGKNTLPIDEKFLEALSQGMPDCCGVAVGFDRLMMLKHNVNTISAILPFDWSES